jgi:hypothetical protein
MRHQCGGIVPIHHIVRLRHGRRVPACLAGARKYDARVKDQQCRRRHAPWRAAAADALAAALLSAVSVCARRTLAATLVRIAVAGSGALRVANRRTDPGSPGVAIAPSASTTQ